MDTAASRSSPYAPGSLLAALAGWATPILIQAMDSSFHPKQAGDLTPYALGSGVLIFIVWLTLLWPLYKLVPAGSVLWRWPVCTACGIIVGTLISAGVYQWILDPGGVSARPRELAGPVLFFGSTIGGTTCLVGALTAPFFRRYDPIGRQRPLFPL